MKATVRASVILSALCLVGCFGTRQDPFDAAAGGVSPAGPATISVYAQNEAEEDVVIYLLAPGRIEKIGAVAPERAVSFRVPWESPRELRIRVEVLAGPRYTTNALSPVSPGDRVQVWVPRNVRRSIIARR